MKKSKVDIIISNLIKLTKPEIREVQNRLYKEHSVASRFEVPADKVGGTLTDGFWLKEAEEEKK